MDNKKTSPGATIRHYTAKDLESCRALWVELTEWHRQLYQTPTIGGDNPGLQFDSHLEQVGPEHLWVAEVDGQVVGLTGLISGEKESELEPLIVSASYRGQGIGLQLAQAVIAAARKSGIRHLTVKPVARNNLAIGFFHELGFNILGQIELFMDFSPEDDQPWKQGEQAGGKDFKV